MYQLSGVKEAYTCPSPISDLGDRLVANTSIVNVIRRVMLGTKVSGLGAEGRRQGVQSAILEAKLLGDVTANEAKKLEHQITAFIEYDLQKDCQPRGTLLEYMTYYSGARSIKAGGIKRLRKCFPVDREGNRVGSSSCDFDVGFFTINSDNALVEVELLECKFNVDNCLFSGGSVKKSMINKLTYMQEVSDLLTGLSSSVVGLISLAEEPKRIEARLRGHGFTNIAVLRWG